MVALIPGCSFPGSCLASKDFIKNQPRNYARLRLVMVVVVVVVVGVVVALIILMAEVEAIFFLRDG